MAIGIFSRVKLADADCYEHVDVPSWELFWSMKEKVRQARDVSRRSKESRRESGLKGQSDSEVGAESGLQAMG